MWTVATAAAPAVAFASAWRYAARDMTTFETSLAKRLSSAPQTHGDQPPAPPGAGPRRQPVDAVVKFSASTTVCAPSK